MSSPVVHPAPKPQPLHTMILSLQPNDLQGIRQTIVQQRVPVKEFGPAYATLAAQSAAHASTFAAAFARSLETPEPYGRCHENK